MRKFVMLVTILTLVLFLVSCGGSTPATTTPAVTTPAKTTTPAATTTTPASTAIDAKALFASNCAMCHGQNREGLPALNAPALTPTTLADDSIAAITGIITDGVPATAMAGFKTRLTSAQIDALTQFVKNVAP